MRILEILALVRIITQAVSLLERLPDVSSPGSVYDWLCKAVVVLKPIFEKTPNLIDDKALQWFQENVTESYDTFLPYYTVISSVMRMISIISKGASDQEVLDYVADDLYGSDDKLQAGISISTILLIIQAVRIILDMLKSEKTESSE